MRRHDRADNSFYSEWDLRVADGRIAGKLGAEVHIVDATEDGAAAAPRAPAAGAAYEWVEEGRWLHPGIGGDVLYERGREHDLRCCAALA